MNYTILILWVALIILCLLWLAISKKLTSDFIDSINYEDEKKNAQLYMEDLLNNKLLYIKLWMHDKQIDHIAVATISKDWTRTMKDFLHTTIDGMGNEVYHLESSSKSVFVISEDQLYIFVPKINSTKILVYRLETTLLANAQLTINNSYIKLSNYLNSTLKIIVNQTQNYVKFNLPINSTHILYYLKNKRKEYHTTVKNLIINYNFLQSLEERFPNINEHKPAKSVMQKETIVL